MPQAPLNAATAVNPAGKFVMNQVDSLGNEFIAVGKSTTLNITTKTVVKAGAGRVAKVIWVVASTAGTPAIYDAATTGTGVAATLIWAGAAVTAIGTVVSLDVPFTNGLVVDPGTTGQVSVCFG